MHLTFRLFRVIAMFVAAAISLLLYLYQVLDAWGNLDFTLESQSAWAKAWNFAISPQGTILISGGSAIFIVLVIFVHRQREQRLNRRRELRERALKRRLERARAGSALSSAPQPAPEAASQAAVPPNITAEPKARLTIIGCDVFGISVSPFGRLSKASADEKVAMVELYREADNTSQSWIEVKAHVEFFDLEGNRVARVNDGFWFKEHEDLTQLAKFNVADSRQLVIALQAQKSTIVFNGHLKAHRRGLVHFEEFIPDFDVLLEGKAFLVRVRLVSVRNSAAVLDDMLNFRLRTEPQLSIESIDEDERAVAATTERIVVDVTPEYLMQFFTNHTAIQARKLVETYLGKWIQVTGIVNNVVSESDDTQVYIMMPKGHIVYAHFREPDQIKRIEVLRRDERVTVLGEIAEIHAPNMELERCELVSAEEIKPPLPS